MSHVEFHLQAVISGTEGPGGVSDTFLAVGTVARKT